MFAVLVFLAAHTRGQAPEKRSRLQNNGLFMVKYQTRRAYQLTVLPERCFLKMVEGAELFREDTSRRVVF